MLIIPDLLGHVRRGLPGLGPRYPTPPRVLRPAPSDRFRSQRVAPQARQCAQAIRAPVAPAPPPKGSRLFDIANSSAFTMLSIYHLAFRFTRPSSPPPPDATPATAVSAMPWRLPTQSRSPGF